MPLIPSWAPNLHPLVIHFPIALLFTAVAIDLVDLVFQRPQWLKIAATTLYAAGTASVGAAFLTGTQAAATVFTPGMAHSLVDNHRTWALVTSTYCAAVAAGRWIVLWRGFPRRRGHRALLLMIGLVAALLVQQTAERGARLVYQHGVGVIPAPPVQ